MVFIFIFSLIMFNPGTEWNIKNEKQENTLDQYEVSADRYGLDVSKLKTLASIESDMHHRCDPSDEKCIAGVVASTAKKPAIGEMQVKQDTANDRGCGSLFDRDSNIECGARQLAWLREKYCGDDWKCMIGSYHDGATGWRDNPTSAGKNHVKKFFKRLKKIELEQRGK